MLETDFRTVFNPSFKSTNPLFNIINTNLAMNTETVRKCIFSNCMVSSPLGLETLLRTSIFDSSSSISVTIEES